MGVCHDARMCVCAGEGELTEAVSVRICQRRDSAKVLVDVELVIHPPETGLAVALMRISPCCVFLTDSVA